MSVSMTEKEIVTAIVYGDTFSLYDEPAFDEFVKPLCTRLEVNGIAPTMFRDKRCLDAGCGGGRGSILMAQYGAREVIGVDLSATNVVSSEQRANQKGLKNLHFYQHSLMNLPFEDESFDIVWCNGVLHHIADPDKGLQEITRVLKIGGHMWLYLYGSGGIYWYMVDWIRQTLDDVNVHDCIWQLRLMDQPVPRVAEWIDDWFTAYLRRYTLDDVTNRLKELGFENTEPLRYGTIYDTSQRQVNASADEHALMGNGDIRHWVRKAGPPKGHENRLPDPPSGKGSTFEDISLVTQFGDSLKRITEGLETLESKLGHEISAYKIIVCRSVHSKVRSLLENKAPFDVQELTNHLANNYELIDTFQSKG